MKESEKAWSELNPTGELRDFTFTEGCVIGVIYNDLTGIYEDKSIICIASYTLHEYKDHYFIVTGNMRGRKKFYLAYKKFERKFT